MPTIGRVTAVLALAIAAIVPIAPRAARADHDLNQIEQVMAGAAGNAAIQFVQLKMLGDNENCQGTATDNATGVPGQCAPSGPGASLLFFDQAGNLTAEYRFPSNTPVGLINRAILIGTPAFAALASAPTPDFIMPPHVVPGSGKVCYKSRPGTFLNVNNCLSYGSFTGSTEGFGSPAADLPTGDSGSLKRVSVTFDNSLDFVVGPAAPTNNAGQTGTVVVPPPPPPLTLAAATLPTSRSVRVGAAATAFATIINVAAVPATGCGIALTTGIPAGFSFQATNASNQLAGPVDALVDIPAGAPQSFVITLTPTAPFAATDVVLRFDCASTEPAAVISGVNTLLLSASATPVPDIVALASTPDNDGIVKVPGAAGIGAFAVASVNVGAPGSITASADTGSAVVPVVLSICQTDPATAQCLSPPAPTATAQIGTGGTPTFSVFVAGAGTVPFDPAVNRIRVVFRDAGGEVRGATSVAVETR